MVHATRRQLEVPLETRSLAPMREFVREVLVEGGLSDKDARAVVIGIDEACTSIVLNADEHKAAGHLNLLIDIDEMRVKVSITDTANDFDLGQVTREELLQEFSRTRRNEMGIFLIRRVMDEFSYRFRKGFQSEIEMIRFLYAEAQG